MINIPLQQLANQSLNFTADDSRYQIDIKEIGGLMATSITIDDVLVISGQRALAGVPLIPYRYLERGNFIFITENEENPYYTSFGTSVFLNYASPAELEALRD